MIFVLSAGPLELSHIPERTPSNDNSVSRTSTRIVKEVYHIITSDLIGTKGIGSCHIETAGHDRHVCRCGEVYRQYKTPLHKSQLCQSHPYKRPLHMSQLCQSHPYNVKSSLQALPPTPHPTLLFLVLIILHILSICQMNST